MFDYLEFLKLSMKSKLSCNNEKTQNPSSNLITLREK